jgi:hypothetical protein
MILTSTVLQDLPWKGEQVRHIYRFITANPNDPPAQVAAFSAGFPDCT